MRFSRGVKRLTVNAAVATVLGSILAFTGTVESEGRQMTLNKVLKNPKNPPEKKKIGYLLNDEFLLE
jgi:hypothetical protein